MAGLKKQSAQREQEILDQLLELLEKMSITVRYDRGFFKGGLVRYKDHLILYLNRKSETQNKIDLIIDELKNIKIPDEFLNDDLKSFFYNQDQEAKIGI